MFSALYHIPLNEGLDYPLLDYSSYLTIHGERGDLAGLVKNATQIMIFLSHHMWAEND